MGENDRQPHALILNVTLLLPTPSSRLLVRVSLLNHFKNFVLKCLFIDDVCSDSQSS
jgi:hypothetical protein